MNLKIVFCLLLVFNCIRGFGQVNDSLLVQTFRESESENGFSTYLISIQNLRRTPVCIMHSIFMHLIESPAQELAVFQNDGSTELYSLEYTMRDTLYDYGGPIQNFNGEIILPRQQIKFRLALLSSNLDKKLKFEFFPVPEFCYPDFKNAIFKNATVWYQKYKRQQRIIELRTQPKHIP